MVSTLLILGVAVSCLALAWGLLRDRHADIRSLEDWEARRNEIDIPALRTLFDRDEKRYLEHGLPRNQFQALQRRRTRLALRMLRLVEQNASMSMRLGQLARMKGDPVLMQKADDAVATAIQLRLNLFVVKLCLFLEWLFPSMTVGMPAFESRYRNLLDCLVRVRQHSRQVST
jgi:hypothetical protein